MRRCGGADDQAVNTTVYQFVYVRGLHLGFVVRVAHDDSLISS